MSPYAERRDLRRRRSSRPACFSASKATSSRSTTSGSAPAGRSVIRPTRRPSTPWSNTSSKRRVRLGDRRGVERVVPADDVEHERGVLHRGGERADLVEAAGEGDEPVAADVAVRRLDPDHAAQRGRLADRATGVAAEGDGGEPGGDGRGAAAARAAGHPARGRAGCASGRTPSSRCSSPWRTRRGSSCRPRRRRPHGRRSTTVASYGGFQPSRIFDEHVVAMPRVHMLSLSATVTPASGPGSSPAATRRVDRCRAARAPVGEHEVERVQLGLACRRWRRGAPPPRMRRRCCRRGRRRRSERALISPPAR